MADDEDEEMSEEEEQQIKEILKSYGSPSAEEKHNIHTLLDKVRTSKDTLKTGNLTKEEVGVVLFPVRTLKDVELIFEDLCGDDVAAKFTKKEAENITAPSLSKDAKFLTIAVSQKREFSETARMRRNVTSNKG